MDRREAASIQARTTQEFISLAKGYPNRISREVADICLGLMIELIMVPYILNEEKISVVGCFECPTQIEQHSTIEEDDTIIPGSMTSIW